MAEIPVEDIDRATANVIDVSEWAEGDETHTQTFESGRQVDSPAKLIADAHLFKSVVVYSAAVTYTDATVPVVEAGVTYAPVISALPIGPEAFNAANWYVLQGYIPNSGADLVTGDGDIESGEATIQSGKAVKASTPVDYGVVQAGVGILQGSDTADNTNLANNAFFDGVDWRYIVSDTASRIQQVGGAYKFQTAIAGVAGNVVTWVDVQTLAASGDVDFFGGDILNGGVVNSSSIVSSGAISGVAGIFTGDTVVSKNNPVFSLDDTVNPTMNLIKNIDGQFIYSADDGSTLAGSNHRWFIDGVEFLQLQSTGTLIPGADGTQDFGNASFRWQDIWATNNVIQTSDINLKTKLEMIGGLKKQREAFLAVAAVIGRFKWLDAIEEKGEEKARWHYGVGAQTAITAWDGVMGEGDAFNQSWAHKDRIVPTKDGFIDDEIQDVEIVEGVEPYILIKDGKAVQLERAIKREIPLFDEYPVTHSNGKPVMIPAVMGEDEGGEPVEVAPAAQKVHLEPRMVAIRAPARVPDEEKAFDRYGVKYTELLTGIVGALVNA
jgi:hypothetical protein